MESVAYTKTYKISRNNFQTIPNGKVKVIYPTH